MRKIAKKKTRYADIETTVLGVECGDPIKEEATVITEEDGIKRFKCVKEGKNTYIKVRFGVEVYDCRSKRRIGRESGKDNFIRIFKFDRVVTGDNVYLVESITDNMVTLRKIGPKEVVVV